MNRLKKHIFYLGGPIDNSPDYGMDWRIDITEFLHHLDMGVFDPLNKATGTIDEGDDFVNYVRGLKNEGKYEEVEHLMRETVRADLGMLDRSSAMILNIDTDIHMCGSYGEQSQACMRRLPVIIHCKQGKNKVPNWLWGICDHKTMFSTWQEVKDYIKYVAFDPNPDTLNGKWKFIDFKKVFRHEKVQNC